MEEIDENVLDADLIKVKSAVELLRKRVSHSTGVFASYNELKDKYVLASNQINELTIELKKLKNSEEKGKLRYASEISSYESIINELKLSMSEKNLIIESLENSIAVKDNELISLRRDSKELIKLKDELEQHRKSKAERELRIQEIELDLLEAKKSNDIKEEQITDYRDKIKTKEDLVSMKTSALSNARTELENNKVQMKNIQSTHESKMKSLSQLIYKLNKEISKLPILESKFSDLRNHLSKKEKKISSMQETIQESIRQISSLDSKLSNNISEAAFLTKLVEELKEKLLVSDSDLEETREALLYTVSTVKKLESEMKRSKARMNAMNQTITSNKSKIGAL